MNLKGRDVINMEKCGRLYELSNMVTTEKNKYFHIASATKEIIKKSLLMKGEEFSNFIKEANIKEVLDNLIPDNTFLPLAKGEFLEEKTQELIRYINFLKGNNYKLIASNPVQDIIVEGEIVTLTADFIFESNNGIEVVKIKRKEPELSYRARTFENKPENNLELFLLSLLGDWLYPNIKFTPSFHHMKAKGDKDLFRAEFNLKKGYNIISHEYNNEEVSNNMERIKELVREIKNKNTQKVYDEQSCRVCPYLNVCNYSGNKNIELEEIKEEIKAPKDFQLTNSQREAVIMTKGIARINAGAGSGKTTVVALRVVELILDGCEPEDIILITFTNKGAQEMRDKIAYWLEQEGIDISKDRFNITTFNAWGDKLIMENPEVFGFTQAPKLIDKVEKYDILFNILENGPKLPDFDYKNPVLNFRYAKGAVPKLESIFDFMKAYNALTEEAIRDKAPGLEAQILDMYKEYNKILKERNLIEYQDQITLIAQIIEEENEILKKENYRHIIVDEYQDSDTMQVDLIMFLSNQPKFESLMVVGDDSQSIFGFRNTSQKNILEFHKMFKEVKDMKIVENFRSTPQIVNLANAINDLNKNKIDKTLISGNKDGDVPLLLCFNSQELEHELISKKISQLVEAGTNPEDIAIIARTKYELFNIERHLKELGVPYLIDVPEPLLNNTNIHIARNLATSISDTELNHGIFEYLFTTSNEFKGMEINEIKKLLEEEELFFKELFEGIEDKELLDEVKRDIFLTLVELMDDNMLNKFIEEISSKTVGFKDMKTYLDKFIEYEDGKTIEKDDKKYKAVILTTAHTSKGKEYPIVFNTITKYTPEYTEKAIEEERRLLFVSLTRAKEKLFITTTLPKENKFKKSYDLFYKELIDTKKCNVKIL